MRKTGAGRLFLIKTSASGSNGRRLKIAVAVVVRNSHSFFSKLPDTLTTRRWSG
jgi:hypothetical protein